MKEVFKKLYPKANEVYNSFCPYRICPLGAHIDHQYGIISGFAIDKGITITYTPSKNGVVELQSTSFDGKMQFHIADVPPVQKDWADYLRGATVALLNKYELHNGIYAIIEGSLPIGGLSSSAAVILAYLNALCDANDIELSNDELIQTALWAEREYVGVNVGKLDQSCEVYSRGNHLLYLDTKDSSYELIPQNPKMKPFEIAIFFSGVERNLVGSAFNMRVDELKAASYALKAFSNADYGKFEDSRLRDVPEDMFNKYKDKLPENWRKRAEHFYTEFNRVQAGAEAWKNGDIEKFGRLCFESGHSSIYNYETGSPELKTIYEIMLETDGIYGGRFSGAGFKGCCMALINPDYKEYIEKTVTEKYLEKFPQYKGNFSVHFCKTADGCGKD